MSLLSIALLEVVLVCNGLIRHEPSMLHAKLARTESPTPTSCLKDMTLLVNGTWQKGVSSLVASDPPLDFQQDFHHGPGWQGLYVNIEHQFAMCVVEKNACTAWDAIFGKIERGNPHAKFEMEDWYASLTSYTKTDPAQTTELFSNEKAVRVMWVRDPLERFASAFLDKCFDEDCTMSFCYARDAADRGRPISFGTAIEWALKGGHGLQEDGHWLAQSARCEVQSRLGEFNLVGLMQKKTVARDATCIMEVAGLEQFNRGDGPSDGVFWRSHDEEVDQNTKAEDSSFHETIPDDKEIEMLRKLFTPDKARELMDVYRADYDLFKLKEPEWVKNATGELMDFVPDTCKPPEDTSETLMQMIDVDSIESTPGFMLLDSIKTHR